MRFFLKGWENVLLEIGSERVKRNTANESWPGKRWDRVTADWQAEQPHTPYKDGNHDDTTDADHDSEADERTNCGGRLAGLSRPRPSGRRGLLVVAVNVPFAVSTVLQVGVYGTLERCSRQSQSFDTANRPPRKYIIDVTSVGQRSSPWPLCNSVKVETKFYLECKLCFPYVATKCVSLAYQ